MTLFQRLKEWLTFDKTAKIIGLILLAAISSDLANISEKANRSAWDLGAINDEIQVIKKKIDNIESDVNFIKHSQR